MSEGELGAASGDDKVERDRVAWEAWGSPLSMPQWLERERLLRAHPWSRTQMETWVWRERGEAVASCETFRMEGHLRQGQARPVYGVASVFVEQRLRRRGHAERMMRALIEHLRRREAGALASILFSDVGAALYERAGYAAHVARPFDWVFPAWAGPGGAPAPLLSEAEVGAAFARIPRPGGELVVWPSREQLDWHLERERFYAHTLGLPRLPAAGAALEQGTVLWAGDLRHRELAVLLLHAADAAAARQLLATAQQVAHRAQLTAVRVWEEPPFPCEPFRQPRASSLPMVAALSPDARGARWSHAPRALWI
jgi:GNAT superfamily N-acetyltransferase